MKIIVGLGNIGTEYHNTRHNIGFMVVDNLLQKSGGGVWQKHQALKVTVATVDLAGLKVLLVKPTTFMNNSGEAIALVLNYYKLGVEDLLVICDDVDLILNKVRYRTQGSAGTHNGLRSVVSYLGTDFARLKIGIESRTAVSKIPLDKFVLGKFTLAEQEIVMQIVAKTTTILLANNLTKLNFSL